MTDSHQTFGEAMIGYAGQINLWVWIVFDVIGGASTFVLWIVSYPFWAGVLLGITSLLLFSTFLAKAKYEGEIPIQTLGHIAEAVSGPPQNFKAQVSGPEAKSEPNIIMLGQPRFVDIYRHKNLVFRETPYDRKPLRALVIDFRNQLEPGREIRSLAFVKSQLTYAYGQAPIISESMNRGFWLDHEFTHTNFERGDTRTLLIGFIFPDTDGDDAFMVMDNKRESADDPINEPATYTFAKYDPLVIKVVLFTQTRHRFHKECEFELTKDRHRQIIKPFS